MEAPLKDHCVRLTYSVQVTTTLVPALSRDSPISGLGLLEQTTCPPTT